MTIPQISYIKAYAACIPLISPLLIFTNIHVRVRKANNPVINNLFSNDQFAMLSSYAPQLLDSRFRGDRFKFLRPILQPLSQEDLPSALNDLKETAQNNLELLKLGKFYLFYMTLGSVVSIVTVIGLAILGIINTPMFIATGLYYTAQFAIFLSAMQKSSLAICEHENVLTLFPE
jgi:hypothetical protein